MKDKTEHLGTKAKIGAENERERHIATATFLGFILLVGALSSYFVYTTLTVQQEEGPVEPSLVSAPEASNPLLKAAIVDQLSLTVPNKTSIETASDILVQAGYTVDYYPGERVTVEFYRNLPKHGYALIIFRVHSTAATLTGEELVECPVCLFTSEDYCRDKYVYEQLTDQLLIASYSVPDPPYIFVITPKFVTASLQGVFSNTTVIMMGCDGLRNTRMAKAFIERGARAYISWNATVSAFHTDTATITLLQHLLTEKQTISQAVENTMTEVGPDLTLKSVLQYYPPIAGAQTVENING